VTTASPADFVPTHRVPGTGLATWPDADPGTAPGPRLESGLEVQVLEQRDDGWAQLACSNGWTAWADGRLLVAERRFTPGAGLATFDAPNPQQAPGVRLDPGLEVSVAEHHPDGWALIVCSNGWKTWVDGRLLDRMPPTTVVPAASPAQWATPPSAGAAPGRPPAAAPGPPGQYASAASAAAAARQAAAQIRALPDFYTRWLPLAGAMLVFIGSFLPWFSILGVGISSWDISLFYLLFLNTTAFPHVGLVLLIPTGMIGAYVAAPFIPNFRVARPILFAGAAIPVVIGILYFIRWIQNHAGIGLSIGPFFVLAGGIAAGLAHLRTRPPGARNPWD